MGNSTSTPLSQNQLDSAPQFHFHGVHHSPDVTLHNFNQIAVFPPHAHNKAVYFSRPLSKATRERIFGLKLKVHFDSESIPVVGFALVFESCDQLILLKNQNVYLWDLRNGAMIDRGKEMRGALPACSDGDILECTMDLGTGTLRFAVIHPGRVPVTKEVKIAGIPQEVWPLVGMATTGSRPASFELMQFDQTKESLYNLSADVAFDAENKFGSVDITEGGKVAHRTSTQQGNSCVVINRVMRSGVHHWKIRVLCDFGASICMGLARYPFKLSEDFQEDPMRHIYRHPGLIVWRSYRGLLYIDGKQQERSLEALGWQHSSSVVVEFRLDLVVGTLEILRNGKSLGIAFKDISGPVEPIVAFYAAYEKKVELLEFHTSEAPPVPVPSPTSKDSPQKLVDVKGIEFRAARFDSTAKYGEIEVSDDGTSVYRARDQSGNAYCLLNKACISGKYRWVLVIEADQGASTCIGVAHEPISVNEPGNIYTSESLYLYRSFQGMLYLKGKELPKRFEEFWTSGTLVELTLEIDSKSNEGVLQLTINGQDQGVAFAGIRPPVKPIVAFYAGMEKKVTLLHFEHEERARTAQVKPSYYNQFSSPEPSTSSNALPIIAKRTDALEYSHECLICGAVNSHCIAMPCRHAIFCSEHIIPNGDQTCLICDQKITGVWNILADS